MMNLFFSLSLFLAQEAGQAEIAELLRRLASDSPEIRDESYRKLKELRRIALPDLALAAKSRDAELAARVHRLLAAIAIMDRLPAPVLKAVPGIEERLTPEGGVSWRTELLGISAGQRAGKIDALAADDIMPLLQEAAKGKPSYDEQDAVYRAVSSMNLTAAPKALIFFAQNGHQDIRHRAVESLIELRARPQLLELSRPPKPRANRNRERTLEELQEDSDETYMSNLGYRTFGALREFGATAELLELLRDGETRGRPGDAAEALAQSGVKEAIPLLLPYLKSSNPFVQWKCAAALGDLGATEAIPALVPLLDAPTGVPRVGALYALGRLNARDHIPAITARLADPQTFCRMTAADALGRLKAVEAREKLIDRLGDPDPSVRARVALALGEIGGADVVQALTRRLSDEQPVTRAHAAVALTRLGSLTGIPTLLLSVERNENLNVSFQAEMIGGGRRPEFELVVELERALKPDVWNKLRETRLEKSLTGKAGPDLRIIGAAAGFGIRVPDDLSQTQYFFGPPPKGTVQEAIERFCLCSHRAVLVRGDNLVVVAPPEACLHWKAWFAERAKTGSFTPEQEATAKAYAEEVRRSQLSPEEQKSLAENDLNEARKTHRAARAKALDGVLTPGLKAVTGLEDDLLNGDDHVWTRLLLDPKRDPILRPPDMEVLAFQGLQAANGKEEKARACTAVVELKARSTVPVLHQLLQDPEVRSEAAAALGILGTAADVPALLSLGGDPAWTVRLSAAVAASRLQRRAGVPILIELTKAPSWDIRGPAARALQEYAGPEDIPHMRTLLKHMDDDPNVADSAAMFLGMQGAREAIPDLITLLGSKHSNPVYFALSSLHQLGAKEAVPAALAKLEGYGCQTGLPLLEDLGAKEAIPAIRRVLEHQNGYEVRQALLALGTLGDREGLPEIRKRLEHADAGSREAAALAIAAIEGKSAVAELLLPLRDKGDWAPARALEMLGASEAVPDLLRLLDTDNKPVSGSVLWALSEMHVSAALPKLLQRVRVGEDPEGVRAIVRTWPKESQDIVRALPAKDPSSAQWRAELLCEVGSREGAALSLEAYWIPVSINAIRNPKTWALLISRRLGASRFGSLKELAEIVASEAGLKLEGPPADSPIAKPWSGCYRRIGGLGRGQTLAEAVQLLQDPRWAIVVEPDRLRVLPRSDAVAFWTAWLKE
jgi:HEAT repeat protein